MRNCASWPVPCSLRSCPLPAAPVAATAVAVVVAVRPVLSAPADYFLFGRHFKPAADRCNADQYNRRWKKMREALGWGDEYQFYSLKDSGIRDLANEQGVVIARDQARHSDVSTTNRYIQEHSMLVHSEVKQFKGALDDDEERKEVAS